MIRSDSLIVSDADKRIQLYPKVTGVEYSEGTIYSFLQCLNFRLSVAKSQKKNDGLSSGEETLTEEHIENLLVELRTPGNSESIDVLL
jgi:hypothetical protein